MSLNWLIDLIDNDEVIYIGEVCCSEIKVITLMDVIALGETAQVELSLAPMHSLFQAALILPISEYLALKSIFVRLRCNLASTTTLLIFANTLHGSYPLT
jgi:hypothetical protein